MRIRLLLALSLIGMIPSMTWAEESLLWRLGGDPDSVAAARKMQDSLEEAQDTSLTQLYRGTRVTIHEDYILERITSVYAYHDMDAVQDYGSESVGFNAAEEVLTVLEAAVISSTGQRYDFSPDSVEINDRNTDDVFIDRQDVVLQLPGLDVGSISILVFERRIEGGLPYFERQFVQSYFEHKRWEFQVSWDGEKPQWSIPDEFLTCVERAKSLDCEATDVPAARVDESVYYGDELPQIYLSVTRSWEDVVGLVDTMVAASLQQRGPLFEEKTQQFHQQEHALEEILSLVSRDIRYVSFSRGENSHQPHGVEDTLSKRYGDCKDKSALMMALLQGQGYEPYAVLVATDRERIEELQVPSHGYFDHMVVCLDDQEQQRCFDATNPYTDASTLAAGLQGKVGLAIRPGAKPEIFDRNPYRWRFDVANAITFAADGGQEETLEREYYGEYAAWVRQKLAGLNTRELQESLEAEYADTVASPGEQVFEVGDLEQLTPRVKITSRTTFAPLVDSSIGLNYEDGAYWLRNFAHAQKADNQYQGFYYAGARINSDYSFDLNTLWESPELGPAVNLQTAYGSFERSYEADNDVVRVHTTLDMPARWIALDKTAEFNRFLDLVIQETRIRFWADKAES